MPQFRSAYNGDLHRQRRAGGARRARLEPERPDRAAARVRGGGDGDRAAARVPRAAPAAAARRSRWPRPGITFGLLWLFGGTLTMADIAVLPVLIGLAVDYAIQFQSRVEEELRRGAGALAALGRAAAAGAPAIAVAALATATGFLVLLLSPVPMVRGFGLLLVAGVAIALLCALAGVAAADGARRAPTAAGCGPRCAARRRSCGRRAAAPVATATPVEPAARAGARARGRDLGCHARPPRAGAGRGGATRAARAGSPTRRPRVQTDVTKLVPSNMRALRGPAHARARHRGLGADRRPRAREERRHAGGGRLDARAGEATADPLPATWRPRAARRPSCARRSRCRTCSPRATAPRARPPRPPRRRSTRCSLLCRATSPRPCSARIATTRRSRSASA